MQNTKPPKGYKNWLDFALDYIDTRQMYLTLLFDNIEIQRDEIKKLVLEEVKKLRKIAKDD